jgi:hypothetical protein
MMARIPNPLNEDNHGVYSRFTIVFMFMLAAFAALLGSSFVSFYALHRIDTLSLSNAGLSIGAPMVVFLASIGLFYFGTRSGRGPSLEGISQERVPSTAALRTVTIPADVDAYLSSLLDASDTGTLVFMRSRDQTVSGVFLSREEYELLNAAVRKKRVTFEEAFHLKDR